MTNIDFILQTKLSLSTGIFFNKLIAS
ncbi:uncharacterized protein METZ01_LOCUS511570 [marine metagenome]|uniref:Uncharacterized protein n=1 Tax=marine metagenome TaxID=408172 RepID=A0A383EPB3_9ZZZZ